MCVCARMRRHAADGAGGRLQSCVTQSWMPSFSQSGSAFRTFAPLCLDHQPEGLNLELWPASPLACHHHRFRDDFAQITFLAL